jgi:hypothetical protein
VADFDASTVDFCFVLLTLGSSAPSKGLEVLRWRGSDSLRAGMSKMDFISLKRVIAILRGEAESAGQPIRN